MQAWAGGPCRRKLHCVSLPSTEGAGFLPSWCLAKLVPECTLLLAGIPPSQISELADAKDQLAAEKERMTEEKHKSLETMTRTLAIATEKVRLGGRAGSLPVEGFAAVPADISATLRQCLS